MSVTERTIGTLSASALLAQIQSAVSPPIDKVPAKWKTTHAWAKLWQKSYSHSVKLVAVAMRGGFMERKEFRIMTESGVVKPIPHYAPTTPRVKI